MKNAWRSSGSWVALVTPFLDACPSEEEAGLLRVTPTSVAGEAASCAINQAVDTAALIRLLDWHLCAGTQGILVLGTTGESPTIEQAERADLIKQTIAYLAGRLPVMVGTGSYSTAQAIVLTQQAYDLGADVALVVCPYYNKPTQEGLFYHYKAIADAVPIPQLLYNVPSRTGCDLLPATVARLAAACSNIVGLKEATAGLDRLHALQSALAQSGRTDFLLYSGEDANTKDFIAQGGDGVISVTANVCPAQVHALVCAVKQGDKVLADAIAHRLAPLNQALFLETNPIPVKWALHEMGYIADAIRLPLMPLSVSHRAALCTALHKANEKEKTRVA